MPFNQEHEHANKVSIHKNILTVDDRSQVDGITDFNVHWDQKKALSLGSTADYNKAICSEMYDNTILLSAKLLLPPGRILLATKQELFTSSTPTLALRP